MAALKPVESQTKKPEKKAPVQPSVCKLGDLYHFIPAGKSECHCGTAKRKKMPM